MKTEKVMSLPCKLRFGSHRYSGNIERRNYQASGLIALTYMDSHGEQIACLTFNPHQPFSLGPNECIIKDYSENAGVLAQLVALGLVRDTGRKVPSGHIEGAIVEILAPELREAPPFVPMAPIGRETPEQCKERWAASLQPLVGQRIVAVSYMTPEEQGKYDWNSAPVVLELEDGTLLYPSADDEGNDAGALFIQSHNIKLPDCAPVI